MAGTARAAQTPLPAGVFSLGVASGDPLPDGIVLWTRLAPDPLHAVAIGSGQSLEEFDALKGVLFSSTQH